MSQEARSSAARHGKYSLRQKVIAFVLVMILLPSVLIWAISNFIFIFASFTYFRH